MSVVNFVSALAQITLSSLRTYRQAVAEVLLSVELWPWTL